MHMFDKMRNFHLSETIVRKMALLMFTIVSTIVSH